MCLTFSKWTSVKPKQAYLRLSISFVKNEWGEISHHLVWIMGKIISFHEKLWKYVLHKWKIFCMSPLIYLLLITVWVAQELRCVRGRNSIHLFTFVHGFPEPWDQAHRDTGVVSASFMAASPEQRNKLWAGSGEGFVQQCTAKSWSGFWGWMLVICYWN